MALREVAGRVFSTGIVPGYLISLVVASEILGGSPLGFLASHQEMRDL